MSPHTKKILVTGANGFVGSALCDHLHSRHFSVCPVVRSVQSVDRYGGFVQVGDIGPETDWSAALHDVDTVIHLAARVHVMKEAAADPLAAFRQVNVDGTLALARQAADKGIKRFIFLSTIKVNGERTSDIPFSESDDPDPQDDYGLSKYEAEKGLWHIASGSALQVVVIRCPLVYGPHVKGNFIRLLHLINKGIPLPLASVKNRRSMISLDNLVDFLTHCIDNKSAAGETFCLSDGHDLATAELIRRLSEKMGKTPRLLPVPAWLLFQIGRLTGMQSVVERLCGSLQVDSSKARQLTAWKPPYTIDEQLKKTVSWFMENK